jgi:hypothetical protein
MLCQLFARRRVIIALLVLQVIPLVLFPPESFSASTQEWWLPVLLVVLVFVAEDPTCFRTDRSRVPVSGSFAT